MNVALDLLVKDFQDDYQHLRSGRRAHDQCGMISEEFARWLRLDDIPCRLVYGFKSEQFMGRTLITQAHIAVEHEGMVYDWTYRQFDADCDFPRITTLEEFHKEWPPLTQENIT